MVIANWLLIQSGNPHFHSAHLFVYAAARLLLFCLVNLFTTQTKGQEALLLRNICYWCNWYDQVSDTLPRIPSVRANSSRRDCQRGGRQRNRGENGGVTAPHSAKLVAEEDAAGAVSSRARAQIERVVFRSLLCTCAGGRRGGQDKHAELRGVLYSV